VRARDIVRADGTVRGVVVESDGAIERLEARLVVAADGRRSVIARKLGLLREHRTLRKFAVRGYWKGVEGLTDHGEMHVTRGGYCGIAPLGDEEANITFVLDQAEMRAAGGGLADFYLRTLERWPRVRERLGRASLTSPPRAIGPLALEARRVSAPGAVLVGDAAGFYDPFTGEGVTLALRGAEIAAEVAHRALANGETDLRLYDRLRDDATRDKFRLNRLLQRIVAWPALANAVAKRLSRRPDLADRLVGIAGDFVPARTAMGAGFVYEMIKG
jgi:flavin-dependent dehydrogenase